VLGRVSLVTLGCGFEGVITALTVLKSEAMLCFGSLGIHSWKFFKILEFKGELSFSRQQSLFLTNKKKPSVQQGFPCYLLVLKF